MKKLLVVLLALCMVFASVSFAFAAGAPKITKQPTSQTTDKNGNVAFALKATTYTDIRWHFVNPETGVDVTGRELRDDVLKDVQGFAISVADGRQKVSLSKVPETMHGWDVYAVLSNDKGYSVETERVKLWFFDKEQTGSAAQSSAPSVGSSDKPEAPDAADDSDASDGSDPEAADESGDAPASAPKAVTVTAEKLTLVPLDSRGNPLEDQAASTLTFESGSGSVSVRSDTPVKYWVINGIRVEPIGGDVNGFLLKNISRDMTVSAKFNKAASTSSENVDPDNPCEVTCTGCVFTYLAGGLQSAASGTVPAGATIMVFASSGADASKGYTVNGETGTHAGSPSFRLKVEDDTTISLP